MYTYIYIPARWCRASIWPVRVLGWQPFCKTARPSLRLSVMHVCNVCMYACVCMYCMHVCVCMYACISFLVFIIKALLCTCTSACIRVSEFSVCYVLHTYICKAKPHVHAIHFLLHVRCCYSLYLKISSVIKMSTDQLQFAQNETHTHIQASADLRSSSTAPMSTQLPDNHTHTHT